MVGADTNRGFTHFSYMLLARPPFSFGEGPGMRLEMISDINREQFKLFR